MCWKNGSSFAQPKIYLSFKDFQKGHLTRHVLHIDIEICPLTLYIQFADVRQQQDIFVRLIDSVTKQVSIHLMFSYKSSRSETCSFPKRNCERHKERKKIISTTTVYSRSEGWRETHLIQNAYPNNNSLCSHNFTNEWICLLASHHDLPEIHFWWRLLQPNKHWDWERCAHWGAFCCINPGTPVNGTLFGLCTDWPCSSPAICHHPFDAHSPVLRFPPVLFVQFLLRHVHTLGTIHANGDTYWCGGGSPRPYVSWLVGWFEQPFHPVRTNANEPFAKHQTHQQPVSQPIRTTHTSTYTYIYIYIRTRNRYVRLWLWLRLCDCADV